jgi:hypothetical protein
MTTYNFYAEPKNIKDDSLIIVTPAPNIHTLKFILLDNNKYNDYKLINEQLTTRCLVEEHHYYKVLSLGWTDLNNCYEEDTIPFSCTLNPSKFIEGIKEFYKAPLSTIKLRNKLSNDNDFKYVTEQIFGSDIDYVDMYFDFETDDVCWQLSKIEVKEVRIITYKNSYED